MKYAVHCTYFINKLNDDKVEIIEDTNELSNSTCFLKLFVTYFRYHVSVIGELLHGLELALDH